MEHQEQPHLTPEEEVVLRRDLLIEKVGRLYSATHSAQKKSWWAEFVNSTMATTLITVVVGGILGQWLLSSFQHRQQRNDLAQDQYRQYIQRQQDVIQQALDLVGTADFDAETLLNLSRPESDPANASGADERKRVADQRAALLQSHTEALKKWNVGRRQMFLLLGYYNYGRPEVTTAWDGTEKATTGLLNCAQLTFQAHLARQPQSTEPCKNERAALDNSLIQLSNAFEQSRQYAWQNVPAPKVEN